MGDLSNVASASASLSIGGTGTVAVAFGFDLAATSVQIQGGATLPSTGVLPSVLRPVF